MPIAERGVYIMEKKNIAILYQRGNLISNEKMELLEFLNSHRLLINKGCSDIYATEMLDIHWVNVKKRNLNKLFEKYKFEKIYNIDVDYSILPEQVGTTYWEDDVKEDIKKAFGEKETVYIPVSYRHTKTIKEAKMYKIDQDKECFKTKEEAEQCLKDKIRKENQILEQQLKDIKERLSYNYKYLEEKSEFNDDIFIVIKKYLDGEVSDIIGYTTDEKTAKSQVKKLHDTTVEGEFYCFDYSPIDKLG